MKKLEKGIQDAIAEHLPQQVAGQMKDVLEDYGKLSDKIFRLEDKNAELEKKAKDAKDELEKKRTDYYIFQDQKDVLKKQQELSDERERMLDKREMGVELEMTRLALGIEREARENVETFMLNMSRVPVYKKTTVQDRDMVVGAKPGIVDNQGCVHAYPEAGHVQTVTDETTETTETE